MLTRAADADKFFAHAPEILCLNNRQIYTKSCAEQREESEQQFVGIRRKPLKRLMSLGTRLHRAKAPVLMRHYVRV
jgi:hypothetical protein